MHATSTSSQPITFVPISIISTPPSIISTPSTTIPSVSMEIPTPKNSHPAPIVEILEGTISTTYEMVDFGEDAVVSLGKYFWSRKEKDVIKKGSKRSIHRRDFQARFGSQPNCVEKGLY